MNDLDQRLMLLGRLLGTVRGLPTAAMYLARHGVPVFPCASGFKRPIVKGGFTAATVDVRQVETWWRRWPDANLAVPTGAASGLDVVDVDRHSDSDTGLLSFGRARDAGLLSGWSSLVETPSGGLHIYFPADPNRPQRIWQAASALQEVGAGKAPWRGRRCCACWAITPAIQSCSLHLAWDAISLTKG